MCRTTVTFRARGRSSATVPAPRVLQGALLGALLVAAGGRAAPDLPTPQTPRAALHSGHGQRHTGASSSGSGRQVVLQLRGPGGKARGLG
jgi:hypothetical protein